MTRTLGLRREILTELTPGDLAAVVGASGITCDPTDLGDLTAKLGCEGTYQCPTWTC